MKVLLLQPPVQDFYKTEVRLQPIGLAYLKASVKKHLPGLKVIIRDYHAGHGRRTVPYPEEFVFLKDFYGTEDKSPFSTFRHYFHFGADFERIAEDVAKEKPDLVGISSLFSPYHREALKTAETIKLRLDVPVLLGGSHVSALPAQTLAHPAVDFVIRGEGERPFVEFLKAFRKGVSHRFREMVTDPFSEVPNLGYKKNGRLVLNPCEENYPVNELPFPDLSDLPKERYLYEGKPLCFLLTSRGCPYRCAFCSVRTTFGNRYRRRSNADILEEFKLRYRRGYRIFDLEDDNLTFDRKAAAGLFQELIRLFPKKDVRFTAMNGICYWNLDPELLTLMKEAGFTHLNLSLVSANKPLLEKMRRPMDQKKYGEVISAAFKLGLKTVSYQILGLPGETISSMIKTLVMNAKLPVLLGASPFYMIPSSRLAASCGGIADPFVARLSALGNAPENNREMIYTLFVTTRILNFLKGLSLPGNSSLARALATARKRDERSAAGVEVLKKLLSGKGFFHVTSQGLKLQPRFGTQLFFKVWRGLDRIVTQEGKNIRLQGGKI